MKYQATLMIFLLYAFICLSQSQNSTPNILCPNNCASCFNSAFCNACRQGFQLSMVGQCIPANTVDNCQLYGMRDTCSLCKPTYRLMMNNTCIKMSDGCLIAGPNGVCSKCLDGATRNQFGQCSARNLNCLKMTSTTGCILCQRGYKLEYGKCINNDPNCEFFQASNGLCLLCKQGYKLLEYRCIKNQQSPNCYLISEDPQICSFCKSGYQSYFGKCYTTRYIQSNFYLWTSSQKRCNTNQYFNTSSQQCQMLPLFCQKFDYGFQRCSSCVASNVIISGLCRDPTLRFCQKFNIANPFMCDSCQQKFFLTLNNLCRQFPPFCQQVSNQLCVKCIDLFLLNSKFNCQDPNCSVMDQQTSLCLKCKPSFFKNITTNICTFQDINCIQKGENRTCTKCKQNYLYDQIQKLCRFKDPNCKIFSDKLICLQCLSGYYIDTKNNACNQLPYKCLSTDQDGNCQYCAQGYALMTSRQCVLIVNISNCQIAVPFKTNVCQKCKQGYYKDINNMCTQSPIFCQKFDPVKLTCQKCNTNSTNRNGLCYDNFCQYFTQFAQCLGCKSGYQYGPRGQCITQKTDQNCKQFMNGRCKICSDRYYFNTSWKCTNVSNLCQSYNVNNGDCTSCYQGYVLDQGRCIRQSQFFICYQYQDIYNKKCIKCRYGYQLNTTTGECYYNHSGCIKRNNINGECLKCLDSYVFDQNNGYCLKVPNASLYNNNKNNSQSNNTQDIPQYSDPNCITYSSNRTLCQVCAPRTYYSKNQQKCIQIDQNCKMYNQKTGSCKQCYDGYNVSIDGMSCVIAKSKDKNCKLFASQTSEICKECYSGYYWDVGKKQCTVIDELCQTANQKTGACLSCWPGYGLKEGKCVIVVEGASNTSNSLDSNINVNQPVNMIDTSKGVQSINNNNNANPITNSINSISDNMNSNININNKLDINSNSNMNTNIITNTNNNPNINSNTNSNSNNIINNSNKPISPILPKPLPTIPQNIPISTPQSQSQSQSQQNCQQYDNINKICIKCSKKLVYDMQLQKCIGPILGYDKNCAQYRNKLCAKCNNGYVISQKVCKIVSI